MTNQYTGHWYDSKKKIFNKWKLTIIFSVWAGCTVVVECSASCYPGGIRTCDKTCENGSKGDKGCEPEGERTEESCNEHSCPGKFNK